MVCANDVDCKLYYGFIIRLPGAER
ncbi:MAG: hypothetical protein QG657_4964, partial [Acidobacteriota bacterium]|nr:hypothetical protein [Acidobacteriota bacterium]